MNQVKARAFEDCRANRRTKAGNNRCPEISKFCEKAINFICHGIEIGMHRAALDLRSEY